MLEVDGVILASGNSLRMGTNKLLLPLCESDKTPLIKYFLTKIPYALFKDVFLVYSDPKLLDISSTFPLIPCYNNKPEVGKSAAIKKGLTQSTSKDGVIFLVADQPFLHPTTIVDIIETFEKYPNSIIVPRVNNKLRNPVLFPKRFKNELLKLQGDEGGKNIFKTHQKELHYLEFPTAAQFTDIDTPEMYKKMEALFEQGLQQ